jgi:hypothetical protein
MSVSKYISRNGSKAFECHIRETEEWEYLQDDPIFREIVIDCKLISIEELVSRRLQVSDVHCLRSINKAEESEANEVGVTSNPDENLTNVQPDHVDCSKEEHSEDRDQKLNQFYETMPAIREQGETDRTAGRYLDVSHLRKLEPEKDTRPSSWPDSSQKYRREYRMEVCD